MKNKVFAHGFTGFLVFLIVACTSLLIWHLLESNWPFVALMAANLLMNVQSLLTWSSILKDR